MSTTQGTEFDLEKMFLPEWAVKPPTTPVKYHTEEAEEKPARTKEREGRFRRRNRDEGRAGVKERGEARQQRRGREMRRRRREEFVPLPRVRASIILNEETVNKTIRQLKMIGRAFPLFELAQKALDYPKNQLVKFEVIKNKDGSIIQPLFLCLLDNTLWLSEAEAIDYVLDKHFSTFYQAERTQIEPPKGKYTFVAQCGLSGIILGPPNHHDYQVKLRKLHSERFSHIPFEEYKMKVRIVRDEEVVKKWIEDQSWRTEYITLNVPEPIRLISREDVVAHFRQVHLPNIIQQVESFVMEGEASRNIPCRPLQRLVRKQWEEEKRFPMRLAVFLSQKFAEQGLQFFKWDRRITYVAVSRPHYLDLEATPVSENVKRIIDYVKTHPGCNRYEVVEALAPSPKKESLPGASQSGESVPTAESTPVQTDGAVAETAQVQPEGLTQKSEEQLQIIKSEEDFTPEQTAIIADIHWLIHQGHIIEFYSGKMYVAKKPRPRLVKEQKSAEAQQKETAQTTGEAAQQPSEQSVEVAAAVQTEPAPVQDADTDVAEPVDFEQLKKDSFAGEQVTEPVQEDAGEELNGDTEQAQPEENKSATEQNS
ncbi:MAG: hypothetical protein ACP5T0_10995 [Verrucomicrobiia bacterium]